MNKNEDKSIDTDIIVNEIDSCHEIMLTRSVSQSMFSLLEDERFRADSRFFL